MTIPLKVDKAILEAARMAEFIRSPKSKPAEDFQNALVEKSIQFELEQGTRKRQRKRKDLESFERAVGAYAADLVSHSSNSESHGHFHRPANRVELANTLVSSRNFEILSSLWEDMGLVEIVATSFNIKDDFEGTMIPEWGRARRYRATSSLLQLAERFGIMSDNVNEHFKRDFLLRRLVIIKYESKALFGKRFNTKSQEGAGELFKKCVSEVREINEFLAKTTTNLKDIPQLYRSFNRGDHPKFNLDMGGRFHCTSDDNWQNKHEKKRSNITINEYPTVEVDVRASQLSVLYWLCKEVPKDRTDPYDILGVERVVVKKIVVAAIGNGGMPKRWPKGFAVEYAELFGRKLQKVHKLSEVVSAIVKRHPVLKRLRASELDWARIQFEESEILRQSMLELIRNYETASLPVHDSLVVRSVDRDIAVDVLSNACHRRLGFRPEVRCA